MRTSYCFLLVASILLSAAEVSCSPKPQQYSIRWVYISRGLNDDRHVEEIREPARTAGEHGINGIYLSASFDRIDLRDEDFFRRLGAADPSS